MDSQKGFAPIVMILAVVTVVIAGGTASYFFVFKQGPVHSTLPSSSSPASNDEQETPVASSQKISGATKKVVISTDSKLLEGLWRIETAYDWVNPPGVWKESDELKMRRPYQEFKNGTMCSVWPIPFEVSTVPPKNLEEALEYTYCGEYKPFRIVDRKEFKPKDPEVSVITFSERPESQGRGPVFQWKIIDGKLEFDKNIYVKIPGTRAIPIFTDTEKPKITSFKISSQSVRVGDEITFTCSATDNSGLASIDFFAIGYIAGGTTRLSAGGQYQVGGEPRSYTYKPPSAGNYAVTCHASDQAQNKAESSLTFSVSQ